MASLKTQFLVPSSVERINASLLSNCAFYSASVIRLSCMHLFAASSLPCYLKLFKLGNMSFHLFNPEILAQGLSHEKTQ